MFLKLHGSNELSFEEELLDVKPEPEDVEELVREEVELDVEEELPVPELELVELDDLCAMSCT